MVTFISNKREIHAGQHRQDKILIYERIKQMTSTELRRIEQLKQVLNSNNGTEIHWEGFQTVVNICCKFVSNSDLKNLMETKVGKKNFSLIVIQLLQMRPS